MNKMNSDVTFRCGTRIGFHVSLVASCVISLGALSADWPQYLGPLQDGKSPEKVASKWPEGGLKTVWKTETPTGFSTFTVVGSKAFTLVAREIDGAKREVCLALDAKTGKEVWAAALGVSKYDGGGDSGTDDNKGGDGPRSTPSADGKRVYVLGGNLLLTCLDAADGKVVWSKDLPKEVGARNISWQSAASPVVDGRFVFVCGGGEGQSLLAFDKATGAVVWKGESDKMTHATPVVATIFGVRQVVFFTQRGLVSAEASSGKVLWRYDFKYSVSTAASPVVAGDIVYCSAGYGVGSAAIQLTKVQEGFMVKELWRIPGNKIANHWSTPVTKDGYLYGMFGFKEYGTCAMKCVELATGKEIWAEPNFGPGGVILAGSQLLALNDRGEVVLVEADPKGYKELARSKAVSGKCWNHPVLSGGRIYARSTKEGACLDATSARSSR